MDSIVEFINEIRQRPQMHIPQKSIFCLKAYLDGWAGRDYKTVKDLEVMRRFQLWVETKYNQQNTQSWDRIIRFYSYDESTALDEFFIDFDKFIADDERSS